MKIHALTTGTAQAKEAFLHAASGVMRQPKLLMPGPFSGPLPIHVFVVEHDGRRLLVDTGEVSTVGNLPFVRFSVKPEDELPAQLQAALGLTVDDIDQTVLTHLHSDHMDGAVHLRHPVLVHDKELAFANGPVGKFFQKAFNQSLPAGTRFEPLTLDDGPFGAFPRSKRLTADGRIIAVATPGHTPAHISIVCIDDDGNHVLLAGDTTDSLEQLLARRPDAIGLRPKVTVATIDAILAHSRQHPTVYVPSHCTESAARLAARTTL